MPSRDRHNPTDTELARRVATGPDPVGAFRTLYERHHENLLLWLRARFPNIAEDIASETWVRALNHLGAKAAEMINFPGWLLTIARNLALDDVRKPKAGTLPPGKDPLDSRLRTGLENLLDAERLEVVRRCREAMNPLLREAVDASAGGEECDDIAKRLRISIDVYYQRKSRGLTALKECVEKHLP